jgi:ketosteroid isomerase-like protein
MRWYTILLLCFLVGCTSRNPIQEAKDVITAHEEYVKAGDLDGILSNTADDIVVLVPGVPLMKGKQAVREFYTGYLAMGKSEFVHEYHGAEVVGDAVVLHGLAKGKLTRVDGSVSEFANNFIITMRYQPDWKMKFWRVAFAPSSQP